jgi:hypothetical protein
MEKAKRILRKVDVQFISLVGKGANGKAILWKSADAPAAPAYEKTVAILSKNDDLRTVYGIVYSPGEVDSQGDTASADVIKDMAYGFMKSRNTTSVDKDHNGMSSEGFVAESWLVKSNDPVFPLQPEGSWAVAIKVENDSTWNLIKSGEIGGLSMAGMAEIEEVAKSESGIIAKIRELLKLDVKKDYNSIEQSSDVRQKLYTLMDAINAVFADASITDKAAAIKENVAQFQADLDAEMTGVEKAGRVISDANMTKLSSAIKLLQEVASAGVSATTKSHDPITQPNEDSMTAEELTKAITDAVKPLNDSLTALTDKLTAVEKAQVDTKAQIDTIAKSTDGSQQLKEDAPKPEDKIWT